MEGRDEVWKDYKSSNAISKSKLRYVSPPEKYGKPIVHLKSVNIENVKGFVGRRPPFLLVKVAV